MSIDQIEKEMNALSNKEKARLALMLIEDLDDQFDERSEQLWIDESQRRYLSFRNGESSSLPGTETMSKIRSRFNV